MKKILLISIGLIGLLAIGLVSVQASTGHFPLVERIAQRFNLNVDEVQEVFDEFHQERHLNMKPGCEERLNQMVEEGKITEEQKQTFLDKKAEMKELSPEERKVKMEEMKQWLEENGIEGFMRFRRMPRF